MAYVEFPITWLRRTVVNALIYEQSPPSVNSQHTKQSTPCDWDSISRIRSLT